MILEVFMALFIVALAAIAIGQISKEQLWTLAGITLVFYLCLILANITGTLQVKTGETSTTTNTYLNSTLTSFTAVMSDTYTNITDVWTKRIGWLMAIASGFAWGFHFSNIRQEHRLKKEASL